MLKYKQESEMKSENESNNNNNVYNRDTDTGNIVNWRLYFILQNKGFILMIIKFHNEMIVFDCHFTKT